MIALCKNSSSIVHLNVRECNQLSDISICNILRSCPLLESLDVTYCSITSDVMSAIQRNTSLSHTLSNFFSNFFLTCRNIQIGLVQPCTGTYIGQHFI
jgi:hypothetical protein